MPKKSTESNAPVEVPAEPPAEVQPEPAPTGMPAGYVPVPYPMVVRKNVVEEKLVHDSREHEAAKKDGWR